MDKYENLNIIGKGNFGSISKIRRKSDGKILVWKEIDYGKMEEKDKHHIISEINILRELHHPNIVKYYDRIIDKKNTKIYIIMEYCSGGDIGNLIKRCKKNKELIEEDIILKIFTQVLLALNYIHTFKNGKILHRDIKPSNIFLDKDNNVKLGDFGLSKILNNQSIFAYSNVGTPYYMSPEQINNNKYNEKSDIWSLGCFLYELTTLNPPFEANNHLSLALKIKSGKIEKINCRYSNFLNKLILWLININPNNRPFTWDLLNLPEINFRVKEKKFKDNYIKMKKFEESLKEREEKIIQKENELNLKEKYLNEKEENIKAREKRVNEREEFIKKEFNIKIKENNYINNNYNEDNNNYEKEGNKNNVLFKNYSEYDNYNFSGFSINESLNRNSLMVNNSENNFNNLENYYNNENNNEYFNYNMKRNRNNILKTKPKLYFPSSSPKKIYHKPINLTNNTSLNTINTNNNSIQSINNTINNQIKTLIYPNHKNFYSIDVNSVSNKLNYSPNRSNENIKKQNLVFSHSKTHSSQNIINNNYIEEISNKNYNQDFNYMNNNNSIKLFSDIYSENNDSQKYIFDYPNNNNNDNNNDNLNNELNTNFITISPKNNNNSKIKYTNNISKNNNFPLGNINNIKYISNNENNNLNTESLKNKVLRKERTFSSSNNTLINNRKINNNNENIYRQSKTPRQNINMIPRNNSYNLTHNYRDNNNENENNLNNHTSHNLIKTNYKNKNNSFRGNNNKFINS